MPSRLLALWFFKIIGSTSDNACAVANAHADANASASFIANASLLLRLLTQLLPTNASAMLIPMQLLILLLMLFWLPLLVLVPLLMQQLREQQQPLQ